MKFQEQTRFRSLSLLLAVQCLIIFGIGPMMAFGLDISTSFIGALLLILIVIVIIESNEIKPIIAAVAALLFNLIPVLFLFHNKSTIIAIWADAIGSVISIIALSIVVSRLVFSPGKIDQHRIVGAIVLYLNAALLFEGIYRLIAQLYPNSFNGLNYSRQGLESFVDLMYFSMTTLTTVGYGDISPLHPVARSIANLEALVGQLYPAIILARIMTLYKSDY